MRLAPSLALLGLCSFASSLRADNALFQATQRSYPTGTWNQSQAYYPQGHVLADLDGDGDLDAAIAHIGNWITPHFSVMKNRGDGSFDAPVFHAISGETADVVAADFDGDGDVDLAFCVGGYGTGDQWVAVFDNNGTGSFGPEQQFVCGIGPTGIVAFDADRDGDTDLATANWYWNEADVSVLYNDGAGGFATRLDFAIAGTQPYRLSAGDLNGDLWPDLAVAVRGGSPSVEILTNAQNGQFALSGSLPPPSGSGLVEVPNVAIADVDRDNDLDVVVGQGAQVGLWGSLGIFRNNGNGTFAPMQSYSIGVGYGHDFAFADLTGDNWPDILCTSHSDNYGFSLLPSDGAGGFGAEITVAAGEWARSISAGDVDGDGDADATVINSGSMTLTVHLNTSGQLTMPYQLDTAFLATGIASGDIDHDGDTDLVTCTSNIYRLLNDGSGTFAASMQTAPGGAKTSCKLRDMNGDGWVDLVARAGSVLVARNEGSSFPGFFQPFAAAASSSVLDFDTFDYDLDGDLDIAATSNSGGPERVTIIPNLGGGNFGAAFTLNDWTITGGTPIVTGDFDNDGRPDIVYGSAFAVCWLNQGGGAFSGAILSAAGGGLNHLVTGDFDGDGNLDLAGDNNDDNGQGENLVVLLGYGDGGFRPPQVYLGMFSIQYGGATGLTALDANGDGRLDLACAAYGDNEVDLFLNNGNGTFAFQSGYGVDGTPLSIANADVDADGHADVLVNIGTGPPLGGALTILRGKGPSNVPVAYCTAGTTSHGCAATLSSTGTASASASSGFVIHAGGVEGQRAGLFFYGVTGRVAFAWGPSTSFLCVKAPTQRTSVQNSGGTLSTCSGALDLDWNAFRAANPNALGQPFGSGDVVQAQAWYRDPPSPKTTHLSNALEFTVQP